MAVLEHHAHRVIALPHRGERHSAAEAHGQIGSHGRLRQAQTARLVGVERHLEAWQRAVKVAAHQHQIAVGAHYGHGALADGVQRVEVVAGEADLDGRHGVAVVELLDAHHGVAEVAREARRELGHKLLGGLIARGVDYELGKVGAAQLRRVGRLESRRTAAVEGGDVGHAAVAAHHVAQAVGHHAGALDGRALGQIHLDGKLVARGARHQLLRHHGEEKRAQRHRTDANAQGDERVGETHGYHTVVHTLNYVEQRAAVRLRRVGLHPLAYEHVLHIGHHQHSHKQRGEQHYRHAQREPLDEVEKHAFKGEQQRKEGDRDAQRGGDDRLEELAGSRGRGVPAAHALVDVLDVAVDDHNGVVDYHAQSHYERGQGDGVELHAKGIENAKRDEYGDGDCGRRHAGHPQRPQQHYHHYHRNHGYQQLLQEVHNRAVDHIALVGDGIYGDVGRQSLLKVIDFSLHIAAKLHYVVARAHLNRQHYALAAVVAHILVGVGIFAAHRGHVAQAHGLARGVAVYHLVGHIGLGVDAAHKVHGAHSALVVDAAAHHGHALRLQRGQQRGAADAVFAQAVAVDVHAYLLLLLASDAEVGQLGNGAQAVFEVGHVVVQLAVGAHIALQRYQHGRSVAEVVVGYQGQHALRQRAFELLQLDFKLAPELILVGNVVVKFHKHVAGAVFRLRIGLGLLYFLEAPQKRLQRLCHLLLHLLRGGTGVNSHHKALPYGEVGKLVFGYVDQREHPEAHQQAHKQHHNALVVHRGLYHVKFIVLNAHNAPTLTPSLPGLRSRGPGLRLSLARRH